MENYKPIPQSFQYPDIPEIKDVVLGGVEETLREDGDWRDYVPNPEYQRRNGIESSSCYVHGMQKGFATLLEEKYGMKDLDYSERYNFIFSHGTKNGGDPLESLASIKDHGMIPDSMLPFSKDIDSWEEFNSFSGGDERLCRLAGKVWRQRWSPDGKVIVTRNMPLSKKKEILRHELKKSPIPVSVFAWYKKGDVYIKPEGERDNHLALLVYIDKEGYPYVFDTYDPFIKKLDKDFNFEFAFSLSILQLPVERNKSFWEGILTFIKALFRS
jgi:hypothetical protein